MHGLLAAAGAELLQLKTIRRVAAVFRRDVVALLALSACQRDARTDVGALACHLLHLCVRLCNRISPVFVARKRLELLTLRL